MRNKKLSVQPIYGFMIVFNDPKSKTMGARPAAVRRGKKGKPARTVRTK